MIVGFTNDRPEAVVVLTLLGTDGRSEEIAAVLDTGFNGDVALPMTLTTALALTPYSAFGVRLADGGMSRVGAFLVDILWDGMSRRVTAFGMGHSVLLGMGLLRGHRLTLDVVDDGRVTIEPITG